MGARPDLHGFTGLPTSQDQEAPVQRAMIEVAEAEQSPPCPWAAGNPFTCSSPSLTPWRVRSGALARASATNRPMSYPTAGM